MIKAFYIKDLFIYLSNFNFKNKVKSLNLNVMGMNNTMTKIRKYSKFLA